DPATGRNRWKVARPAELNYTTPLVVRRGGRTEVVVQSEFGVDAYDPQTGEQRWKFDGEKLDTVASPVAAGDLIVSSGKGLFALRPGASGRPDVAWKAAKLGAVEPTPLVAGGRVYVLRGEFLLCGRVSDGKELSRRRVKGPFSASPVLADGKLYAVNEE